MAGQACIISRLIAQTLGKAQFVHFLLPLPTLPRHNVMKFKTEICEWGIKGSDEVGVGYLL